MNSWYVILVALLSLLLGCSGTDYEGSTQQRGAAGRDIRIVLNAEPVGLNPVLTVQNVSRYVSEQIFQTLNAQHPQTFELQPSLASLPLVDSLPSGGMSYRYSLDAGATWPNGEPVLASDVVFSLKVLLNPLVDAGPYRPYYTMISDIVLDSTDHRYFEVLTKYPYLLAAQAIGDLYIYPEYAYDPDGLMRSVSLSQLTDPESADRLVRNSWEIQEFARRFNDPPTSYQPDKIVGSGPYRLESWESGQKLLLVRRDNYWALDRSEAWLAAQPDYLTFLIIPDNTTTANALRDHMVDVVVDMPIEQFRYLRDEAYLRQYYDFLTVPGFKYYSILLNQDDPLMSDSLTRRAFAHTVDVDKILDKLLPGLAERVNGPVLPTKSYYNRNLATLPYDPTRARELLRQAGWEDQDGDGIVEREIDGKRRPLRFSLLSFTTPTSEAVSIVVAEGAREAGIDVEMVKQESRTLLNHLSGGKFTASFYAQGYEPIPDDFSQVWYSSSVPPSGTNRGNFNNPEADRLIERIARTTDPETRVPLYLRFQEIVYNNQPMIFLYSPYDRLVVSKELEHVPTSLAPNLNFNALRAAPATRADGLNSR